MIGISQAAAAQAAAEVSRDKTPPINSPFDYFVVHVISNTALVISLIILIVGLIALVLQFKALKNTVASPTDVLRICAVTLIITFSLALAGFLTAEDLKEASPIFGLFSTIAGYLLGSAQRGAQSGRSETTRPIRGPSRGDVGQSGNPG
jgi:hypothetical protein